MNYDGESIQLRGVEDDFRWVDIPLVKRAISLPEPGTEFYVEASYIQYEEKTEYKLLFLFKRQIKDRGAVHFNTLDEMLGVIKNPELRKQVIKELV